MKKLYIGMMVAVVALSVGFTTAKAQSFSIREEIVQKAVDRIVEMIMGGSVANDSLGSTVPREQTKSSTVTAFEGPVGIKNSNRTTLGSVDRNYKVSGVLYGTLPGSGGNSDSTTATTTDYFVNNAGKTLYVDLSTLTLYNSGTASTTMQAIFATSTAPFAYDSTPAPALWTYTYATTTKPGIVTAKDTSFSGSTFGLVPVLDGEYFSVLKKQQFEQGCNGSLCENATSTNWGLTANWAAEYHFFEKY